MKRSITSSVLVFIITAMVGTALNAYGNTKQVEQQASVETQTTGLYWVQ